ncbi:hypothetical protein FHW36_101841 [Chitinophaga polysaccharea]|uniref:Uncharacterized protein n=1 Tax=Chitinophaga polysaccharea TaxID=1293035 RepID=A0A561Q3I1_9BACT|nr:hypothetical protein FHW36_101841 [Chitinophaga polysaccharea]
MKKKKWPFKYELDPKNNLHLPSEQKAIFAYIVIWILGIMCGLMFLLLFAMVIQKLATGDY